MAVTFTGAGTAVAASGASPQAVTTATSFAVGDFLVALISYDNSGGGGADPMTGTISVAPATGAVGASVSAQTGINDPGTASSGLAARCVAFPVTTIIPTSTSCNVSWSGTVVVRAVAFMKVSSAGITGYRTNSGATGTNAVASAGPTLTTPSINNTEGVLCWAAYEYGAAPGADADTTNGTWSARYGAFTGSTTSGQSAHFQSKVVTATATQAFNPTGTASDWILGCLIFTETIPPAITQAAYRFYDDTGTESTSPPLQAQDTAHTGNLTTGDGTGQFRVRLQSTTAIAVPATDDFQLQWEKNASGTWNTVPSGAVIGYDSPTLTEAGATTSRLTGGTGSFVAGKIAEDGVVDNLGWGGNNFTELVFSVKLVAAELANGDTVRFRVIKNGATTDMTYAVTPTINIIATPPQTWTGSDGTAGVAGVSGDFVAGEVTWDGSVATVGVEGVSGDFSLIVPEPQTWGGSTATAGVAGVTGTFTGGATTWTGGSTATAGVAGVTGSFVGGATTWTGGSTATVGASGSTGPFTGGSTTWTGGSTATIGVAGVSGSMVEANAPQTWSGSTATVGAAGQTGSFSSTVAWSGSTATIGAAGTSGSFAAGPVTWQGSTATIGAAGVTGAFVPAAVTWGGSTGTAGVAGVTGTFVAGATTWAGSTATVGVAGQSGAFTSGSAWAGSTATVGAAGVSGSFVGGPVVWSGSTATVGVAGQTGLFSSMATWLGSVATVGVSGVTGEFVPDLIWAGSVATVGVTGVSGTWIAPIVGEAMGQWDGQEIVEMMWGGDEVAEWWMVPA